MRPPAVRGAVAAVLLLAGALSLSSCSGASDPQSGAASSPSTSSAAPAGLTATGLTAAQIKAALPRVAELPKGWKVDPTSTLTGNMTLKDSDTVTPASCTPAGQVQQNFNFVAPADAHGSVDFVGGAHGLFSGVTVYSFDAPYPASALAAIRASVAKCPTYQETEDDGTLVTDQVALIPTPSMGEESLGLEVSSVYQGTRLDLVTVLARSGNTLVAVEDAGAGTPASAARAEKLVRATLARLPHP